MWFSIVFENFTSFQWLFEKSCGPSTFIGCSNTSSFRQTHTTPLCGSFGKYWGLLKSHPAESRNFCVSISFLPFWAGCSHFLPTGLPGNPQSLLKVRGVSRCLDSNIYIIKSKIDSTHSTPCLPHGAVSSKSTQVYYSQKPHNWRRRKRGRRGLFTSRNCWQRVCALLW